MFLTHHNGTPAGPGTTCNCSSGSSGSGGVKDRRTGVGACMTEVPNCDWHRNPNQTLLPNCTMLTYMSFAHNPAGPWSPLVSLATMQTSDPFSPYFPGNPYSDANFAPIIEFDGSLLAWTRDSIVRARDWRKPETYKVTGQPLSPGAPGIGEVR